MFGRMVAGLIVVGLAIGVWVLWPRAETASTTTTSAVAAETTTSATPAPSSPPPETTRPGDAGGDVIDTVEKAQAVLRDLWFGWFEGIYDQDVDRIKEVVASSGLLENATDQFGVMEFSSPPTKNAIGFVSTEVLYSGRECAVIWASVDVPFRGGTTTGANVIRKSDNSWVLVAVWAKKNDLWQQDCEAQLEPLP